jgi:hypothetical protein
LAKDEQTFDRVREIGASAELSVDRSAGYAVKDRT